MTASAIVCLAAFLVLTIGVSQARFKAQKRAGPTIGCCAPTNTASYGGNKWSYNAETNSMAFEVSPNERNVNVNGMSYAIDTENNCLKYATLTEIDPKSEYCLRGSEVEDLGTRTYTSQQGITRILRSFRVVLASGSIRFFLYDPNEEDCLPIVTIFSFDGESMIAEEDPGSRSKNLEVSFDIPEEKC